jgi:thiol:disulfide interchange protein DsbD
MLKLIYTFLCLSLTSLLVDAQILNPVKWSYEVKDNGNKTVSIIFKAKIDKGWHIYSMNPGDGPFPTSFTFTPSANYTLDGITLEGKPKKEFDEGFQMDVLYFEREAVFTQNILVKSTKDFKVNVLAEFQACSTQCVMLDNSFEINIKGVTTIKASGLTSSTEVNKKPDVNSKVNESASVDTAKEQLVVVSKDSIKIDEAIKSKVSEFPQKARSGWGIFWAGFFGGLLALLTPCVFPMIPMTVSFFTKRSKTRAKGLSNALIYSFNIIFIYTVLGFIITKALGPDALNELASNGIFNFIFFIIILLFAISFLGAFEIVLPTSFINKIDAASDRGGFIGIFFMAFTLSLVSFSCTGPIIGTLLVEAAVNGSNAGPLMGMFGFSSALALPFGLFALFPGWLNSLPKSGGWLNSVKVVLGLLELALALKFLSNVDLAYNWGLLTREIFIAVWVVIFVILGFYLLGKLKFSHDSDIPYVSIPRLILAIISFSFVVYLIPGMWGAPLKLISGFPPPLHYNEGWKLGNKSDVNAEIIPGTSPEHCPHGLNCFHDYQLALEYAKKVNKPLMIDFTGKTCVNCRKMEDNVWSDPRVLSILQNDYVLVSLYVDDKTNLPEKEQFISSTTGKKIKTVGNKWSNFQTEKYQTNSQPYYVLVDKSENLLTNPESYNPDIHNYIGFLEKGKKEFKARN